MSAFDMEETVGTQSTASAATPGHPATQLVNGTRARNVHTVLSSHQKPGEHHPDPPSSSGRGPDTMIPPSPVPLPPPRSTSVPYTREGNLNPRQFQPRNSASTMADVSRPSPPIGHTSPSVDPLSRSSASTVLANHSVPQTLPTSFKKQWGASMSWDDVKSLNYDYVPCHLLSNGMLVWSHFSPDHWKSPVAKGSQTFECVSMLPLLINFSFEEICLLDYNCRIEQRIQSGKMGKQPFTNGCGGSS
ncbi:hypothetical protein P152DRAFT_447889 [Eremomyces bilateralis CBS 781.70]|uniref:Uncharacterized protein n=1 Tax=Eremomyces bilateralis CBS 781.70 TaxID=1392243 RepID=A0A6G1G9K5_9PEZI|nr:uncharacterized protein P152DRAFT_447889 [Eremomyces bilateralis CBS 781.70]KAF1814549.1 hypothetical protein P152DRAFT_447889 [Eremomyces bilateralis CBS 781.70]